MCCPHAALLQLLQLGQPHALVKAPRQGSPQGANGLAQDIHLSQRNDEKIAGQFCVQFISTSSGAGNKWVSFISIQCVKGGGNTGVFSILLGLSPWGGQPIS